MVLGTLEVTLQIPNSQSLKAKRQVVRSLTQRLRQRFNVAVAEVDNLDVWQLATLAVVAVAGDSRHVDEVCQKALDLVNAEPDALVTTSRFEVVHI